MSILDELGLAEADLWALANDLPERRGSLGTLDRLGLEEADVGALMRDAPEEGGGSPKGRKLKSWDPRKHPQTDRFGPLRRVLADLAVGGGVRLPDGTEIVRTAGGFAVDGEEIGSVDEAAAWALYLFIGAPRGRSVTTFPPLDGVGGAA
jgi:hypothetical protein